MRRRRSIGRSVFAGVACLVGVACLAGVALGHGGALGGASRGSVTVPTWLFVSTGGAAVGASFLLASFVTDRSLVAALHADRGRVALPPGAWRGLTALARTLGVAGLAGVLVVGFAGPADALSNAAVLVVWAGWWAGYAMSTYLAGNTWPALNPWRTIADLLPDVGRTYVWRWGAWPSVAGLLALIWLEVVSPLADRPRLLALTVLAYSVVALAGAIVYGGGTWFREADPVARVFRYYGRVAPLGTDGRGRIAIRLPGAALAEDALSGFDEVAFVVALLWVTTFDGLVATPAWGSAAAAVVRLGVPPWLVYPAGLVTGYLAFLGVYVAASRLSRRTAGTYVASGDLARRFAPPLLAIAAGYHLAHFLGYFLTLSPALVATVTAPFADVNPSVAVLPGWFDLVAVAAILLGHVLAVGAAHAAAFDVFPDRLQAIRSQYPFVVAMVFYTMVSLWIVTRPEVTPPYI